MNMPSLPTKPDPDAVKRFGPPLFTEAQLIAYGRQCVEALKTKIPDGRITNKWENTRVEDYNKGWNNYREAIRNMLKGETE
jgi:hypothetical protein